MTPPNSLNERYQETRNTTVSLITRRWSRLQRMTRRFGFKPGLGSIRGIWQRGGPSLGSIGCKKYTMRTIYWELIQLINFSTRNSLLFRTPSPCLCRLGPMLMGSSPFGTRILRVAPNSHFRAPCVALFSLFQFFPLNDSSELYSPPSSQSLLPHINQI